MFAAIDTGTTNTRVYLIEDEKIIGRAYKKVGVRDTVISGSKDVLKRGIIECFQAALESAGAAQSDVRFAVASGMIVSEIGLINIPHLIAPIGIDELVKGAVVIHDVGIFPIDIPVVFVPGIRNGRDGTGLAQIRRLDFMKGEETQVMGALIKLKPKLPCNFVILSSHTKIVHVDEYGKITGSITSISGQVYEAIKEKTSIGKSICTENTDFYSDEIVDLAYDCVKNAGLLRTFLMPRFMEVLLETESYERRFFVDAAIASDDMSMFNELDHIPQMVKNTDYLLIGHESRCRIYQKLIRQIGIKGNIASVCNKEEIDDFVVQGDIWISKEAVKQKLLEKHTTDKVIIQNN